MIRFALCPTAPISCPSSLRGALVDLSRGHGELFPGHLDARVDFSLLDSDGERWMDSQQCFGILERQRMPLVWKCEDMGCADLFLSLTDDSAPYEGAWAAFERKMLSATSQDSLRPTRSAMAL